ncbi:uncharacterized protein LOC111681495 [Lucilia cuprina]|uniref:uncharacterized protein LOC111681495 n=1 Tax=Lucilia cuprina TaxID=7375 RepID=UPI001F05C276|nr:uncharacterized protein LOC111681495 [Lucilia cuprina]
MQIYKNKFEFLARINCFCSVRVFLNEKMSCAICFERFKGADNNLYSTTCGHIYHFVCMQQWKSRSTSCPQCRAYNPKTHKIYLELNDEEPNSSLLEDQLRVCRSKVAQLELELKRSNERVSKAGNTIKCQMLEETLESTLEHNSNLEKKLTEAEIKINELQKGIRTLNVNINKISTGKNKLEQNYANLQVEYNRIKLVNESPNSRITSYISNLIRNSSIKISRTLIIPGSNLTNYVLYLGHKMDVHYVRSDIIKTVLLNDENTLLVQFKTPSLREIFYSNRPKLNYHSETETIQFGDVTNEILLNSTLFDYALNLKMFNYKSIFRQNKKVMARKDDYEDPIRIYSREHVEELIEEEGESYEFFSGFSFCLSY